MLKLISNYISEEEEKELLSFIIPSRHFSFFKERNSIRRYGSTIPYAHPKADPHIPAIYQKLCDKLYKDKLVDSVPDSVTLNEYKKGQGISYHVDSKRSGPSIIVLSLGSEAVMGLRKGKDEYFSSIPPRTLVIMDGETRWDWEHCILPVQSTRYSLVFRKGTK